MATQFTSGSKRISLSADQVQTFADSGALVLDTRRRRPLYFDGRFLAARDLAREQDYFLQRQADLGRSAGFGVVHGLTVQQQNTQQGGKSVLSADGITISSGQGVTPSGELVLLPDDLNISLSNLPQEQNLDLQFGVGRIPLPPRRTRSGLFVLALRAVEFTANPITSYPTSIQGSRQTHDGDIIEATAVALVPFPDPGTNYEPAQRRSAVAWQIFSGSTAVQSKVNDSLLPLAIVSLQRGVIEWLDQWLVRREVSADYAGQQFGLTDRATQTAFLMQYDQQLHEIVGQRGGSGLSANFAATQYFRLLPPMGRMPMGAINFQAGTQSFFPAQLDVRLSIIPDDELPALFEDGLNLPPLDLTLQPDDYSQLAVFILVPVARADFAKLVAVLKPKQLQAAVPQIVSFRRPIELLQLYRQGLPTISPAVVDNADWSQATGKNQFAFYTRRRSAPQFVDFTNA
jgi:hypothetical protein